jgi:hypothetical protein
MKNKIIELFNKYSKSVDTEYNVYNCLIEEDWSNITQELIQLFRQPAVINFVCDCSSETFAHHYKGGDNCGYCGGKAES